jgi:hypothetical protein
LIVWEKNDKDIQIICPYYTSYVNIIKSLELNPIAIMILKEGDFYEPIELKLKGRDGEKTIKLNDFPEIKMILNECDKQKLHIDNNAFINLNLYHQFLKTKVYDNPNDLYIQSIIINNDLSINKLMTKSNILLHTETINIAYLPTIIKNLNIKNILFYDDIANNKYDIKIMVSDLNILIKKCKEYKIIPDIGTIKIKTHNEIYSTLTLPKSIISNNFIIHSDVNNQYYDYVKNEEKYTKKWYELQKLVAIRLIKNLDDAKIDKIIKQPKLFIIKHLLSFFKDVPETSKIKIILEEVPLFSIKMIKEWFNTIVLYIKYEYYTGEIKETKNEFLFTQYNVTDEIPKKLLLYHKALPNTPITESILDKYIIDDIVVDSDKLPMLYNGILEKLKSKWTKHKKLIWSQMSLIRIKYNKTVIQELFSWLSNLLGYNINYKEIRDITRNKYYKILPKNDIMMEMFYDPSFYSEYIDKMNILNKTNKKFSTLQIFWDSYYTKTNINEKKKIIDMILDADNLYPNDLEITSISEMLNISFLIIHRTKYGKTKEPIRRGEIEDFVLSSTLIPAISNIDNRPLIILAKEYDKLHINYFAIVENGKNIYLQLKDSPQDIKMLVNKHLEILQY